MINDDTCGFYTRYKVSLSLPVIWAEISCFLHLYNYSLWGTYVAGPLKRHYKGHFTHRERCHRVKSVWLHVTDDSQQVSISMGKRRQMLLHRKCPPPRTPSESHDDVDDVCVPSTCAQRVEKHRCCFTQAWCIYLSCTRGKTGKK